MKVLDTIGNIFAYGFYIFLILVGGLFSLAFIFVGDFSYHLFIYLAVYHLGGLGIASKLKRRQDLKEAQELLEQVRAQTERTLEEMRSMCHSLESMRHSLEEKK